MAIRWLFYRDTAGLCRWEVRGAEGPIATSGAIFESIEDCIADARTRGFRGPSNPPIASEAIAGARHARAPKHAAR